MAAERDEETVNGFGGAVVQPPPWWLEDRVLQELYDERPTALAGAIQDHFTEIGRAHAADVATRLIVHRRSPWGKSVELDAAVAQFGPAATVDEAAYADGLCTGFVEQAQTLRESMDWIEDGLGLDPPFVIDLFARIAGLSREEFLDIANQVPGAADGDARGVDALFRRAGGLSRSAVLAMADQFEDLARTLSARAQLPLPRLLREAEERRQQEHQARTAAAELAEMIDRYSVLRSIPQLAGGAPSDRADEREQLAAQIAAVYTRQPDLRSHLADDRTAVLQFLLPNAPSLRSGRPRMDAGVDHAINRTVDPAVGPAQATSTHVHELHSAAEAMTTALTEGRTRRTEALTARIAALHRQDPTAAQQLSPVQAGLVRHISARGTDPEKSPTQARTGRADRRTSVRTPATTASHQTTSVAVTEPPGTAGSRHTAIGSPSPGRTPGR